MTWPDKTVTVIAAWDKSQEKIWVNGSLRFLRTKPNGSCA